MTTRIFALDIGTRSVTGIILEQQQNKFAVIDYCILEHKERSMYDGQIHNIVAVSDVVIQVKNELESRHGPLKQVCVAAAGRALKTVQAKAKLDIHQQPITDEETIKHLELSAVQVAQQQLVEQEEQDYEHYYCVGYSVLHYQLDDDIIGSLIDQKGDEASVEIIATFLPKVVVESLMAVLQRAGLDMEALTLEPIAAIQVLIPESMRRLNVALIDIGAGTSDVAITNYGTIVAYGMVPMAGDEITEAISDHYLLDFKEAEQAKRDLVNHGVATITDILGFETNLTREDVVEQIKPKIIALAKALTEEVLRLNKKAPQAVMLIGGGSLTPELSSILATQLHLPPNRVAVRGMEAVQNIEKHTELPTGPDFITPIGIAIAAKQSPIHYIHATVNGSAIQLFEVKQLTVGDCLVQAGIEINKWYGKPGLAYIIQVNGKNMTLPGQLGTPPTITLNGEMAQVETPIRQGDQIIIEKGEDGLEPHYTISELFGDLPPLSVTFNGEKYDISPQYKVNQEIVDEDYVIQDNDSITFSQVHTVKDFLSFINHDLEHIQETFTVYLNGREITLKSQAQLMLNGRPAQLEDRLKDGDELTFQPTEQPTVADLIQQENLRLYDMIVVTFNGEPVQLTKQNFKILREEQELTEDSILYSEDELTFVESKLTSFIFQDVFRYVDIDLSQAKGTFQLYKNNEPATFYEPIQHGDELILQWE